MGLGAGRLTSVQLPAPPYVNLEIPKKSHDLKFFAFWFKWRIEEINGNSSFIPSLDNYFLSIYCDMPWARKVSKNSLKLTTAVQKTYQSANISKHIKPFSSVQSLSPVRHFATHELQHARPPCPSQTPRVYSNSCPSSRWCHPAISSSAVPFSSCPQSLPASGSFPMSQLFSWGGQSIGVSVSASVLPMNTQDWSPSGKTGWISLQSKGLSRVFSNTTVQKHQFFGAQLSSQSNSHIHTWPLEKP